MPSISDTDIGNFCKFFEEKFTEHEMRDATSALARGDFSGTPQEHLATAKYSMQREIKTLKIRLLTPFASISGRIRSNVNNLKIQMAEQYATYLLTRTSPALLIRACDNEIRPTFEAPKSQWSFTAAELLEAVQRRELKSIERIIRPSLGNI